MVRPNLYYFAQGSSSFPKMTLIAWKAAGTFRPISRPISTSGWCRILSATWDQWVHWLAPWGVAMSSWEAGMYSRKYASRTLIGAQPLPVFWVDNPLVFLVPIVFEPRIVLTCRCTSGASISSCCSKVSGIKTSEDWSSRTACVVHFLAGLDWWDACTRTILAHELLVSSSPQTCD